MVVFWVLQGVHMSIRYRAQATDSQATTIDADSQACICDRGFCHSTPQLRAGVASDVATMS